MSESTASEGAAFLNEIFDRLDLGVRAEIGETRDDTQIFALEGATDALDRAPGLRSAIALLASQALSRAAGHRLRCALDVDGRLAQGESLVEQAAGDIARAVSISGRRAVLDGLSAAERRVVHTALADAPEVATRSDGAGPHRWLYVERREDAAE